MRFVEKLMRFVFLLCALTSVLAVLVICLFLFIGGIPAMGEIGLGDFLFGLKWAPGNVPASYGIFPMILGSLAVTFGALLVGVPIGLLTAIFLARFCPKRLYRL